MSAALTVPSRAVYILDGKSVVVVRRKEGGKESFVPVPVEPGVDNGEVTQILSGLRSQDEVIVEGGLAFLYPDFKSGGDD
jgi:hypothetical protein